MKQKPLLLIITILFTIAAGIFIREGWIYFAIGCMAVTVFSMVRSFSSVILSITRWSKNNPRKAQVLITLSQLIIFSLAILVGNNLKQLGYTFGDSPFIIFLITLLAGFFSVHFLPKKNTIAIPLVVNRHRMAYMSIILSGFALMVTTGNRIGDRMPGSTAARLLHSVDQTLFVQQAISDPGQNSTSLQTVRSSEKLMLLGTSSSLVSLVSINTKPEPVEPESISKKEAREKIKAEKKSEKLEKKKKKMINRLERMRKNFSTGATVGIILLIVLLVATSCAGICLLIAGISGGGSFALVPLGALIAGGSIFGIIKLGKKLDRQKSPEKTPEKTPEN